MQDAYICVILTSKSVIISIKEQCSSFPERLKLDCVSKAFTAADLFLIRIEEDAIHRQLVCQGGDFLAVATRTQVTVLIPVKA